MTEHLALPKNLAAADAEMTEQVDVIADVNLCVTCNVGQCIEGKIPAHARTAAAKCRLAVEIVQQPLEHEAEGERHRVEAAVYRAQKAGDRQVGTKQSLNQAASGSVEGRLAAAYF